mmetsp:Transcript_89379/g.208081  ORF Transcript_89379/g.208081 Transcript_89379/m.208081 type:complete len:83 (+) Transcript_89379:137-385(+)
MHNLVHRAVDRCGVRGASRPLLTSVALAGGTANLTGLEARLRAELCRLGERGELPGGFRPQVLRFSPEPAWVGGSLLGVHLR